MGLYRWSIAQSVPIILSYAIAGWIAAFPAGIAEVATLILPSWLISYTPSTIAYSWFRVDGLGRVHYAWSGRYATGWTADAAKALQFLVSGTSAVLGYISVLSLIGTLFTSLWVAFVAGGLGGAWGYVCGYIVSRNTGSRWW